MRRYARVYRAFFTSSFARELEFRVNFFAKVAQNAVWLAFFLMIVLVVYRNTDSVAGWTRGEALALGATWFLMNSLVSAFAFSLMEVPEHVRRGTLDFIITKPVDAQFWISLRRFSFDQIGMVVVSLAVIVYAANTGVAAPSLAQWAAFSVLAACSALLAYAFNLFLMTFGIWLVRVDNLFVLSETVTGIARFPLDIYNSTLQKMLTYGFPLAFLATIPVRQLVDGVDGPMVAVGVAWAAGATLITRLFWNFALTRYTSASS